MKHYIFILSSIVLLSGCAKNEQNEKTSLEYQSEIDSLQEIVSNNEYALVLLSQIDLYLDSIDYHRNWIKLELESTAADTNLLDRMRQLNLHTQKAEWTIGELEKTRVAYVSQVKRLKTELNEKQAAIENLRNELASFQLENSNLEKRVEDLQLEVASSEFEIEKREEEISAADSEIQRLLNEVRLTEAEKYFAEAEGMVAVADHMQFAPRKKKKTLEEAINRYDRALALGYKPAGEKLEMIRTRLQ
jgi:chromosome segregation ATPase